MKNNISYIYDFGSEKVFDKVLAYTSIILIDKSKNKDYITYVNSKNQSEYKVKKDLLSDKWIFIEDDKNNGDECFEDYFKASYSVATLLNEAFVVDKENIKNIEPEVLKDAVSPKKMFGELPKIIYPYSYKDGKLVRYSEEEFTEKFPNASKHLKKYKKDLIKRKSDKSALWFEYGRSQAIKNMNNNKLVISSFCTNEIKVKKFDNDAVAYSGIYIISNIYMT